MVKGIDLSDLILKLLFFDIKTLMIGSLDAKTLSLWKTQINKILIRQHLPVSYTHLRAPRDATLSRMPSSA